MERSSESEFRAALAPASVSASCGQSVEYTSEGSKESGPRGGRLGSIDKMIELSKSHWSELAGSSSTFTDDEVAADNLAVTADNLAEFEKLQRHRSWGRFFRTFGYDTQVRCSAGMMEVGEKFAEGGQAELFKAKITWKNRKDNDGDVRTGIRWVLKVFKRGTLLGDLEKYWPHGYLHWWAEANERVNSGKSLGKRYHCHVMFGTLLRDGRFAFLMTKEHMDLRSLINSHKLESGYYRGPFQEEDAEWYMYRIARGIDWLHQQNIVHRDLKASNVLVRKHETRRYSCYVADFECSVGVVGTGFWRAPEILQAVKKKTVSQKPELFSKKADAYSYAMTCYEVLTGKTPFEDHSLIKNRDLLADLVIKDKVRPEVPNYVTEWTHNLLWRCWDSNPSTRPSFEEILKIFEVNSKSQCIRYEAIKRKELEKEHLLEASKAKVSTASWVRKRIWKT